MHIFIRVYLKHQKFSLFLHKGAVWGSVFGRAGVLCSVGSVFVSRVHRMDMGKKAVPAVCTAYENGSPFKTRGRMEI